MTHAVRIHAPGGPEAMRWESVPTPEPGPGEALIRHGAVGLNYIDVYFRTGLYKAPQMPLVVGQEGAGTVLAVGPGVTAVAPGDRVAYAGPLGAYATERTLPADRLVKLPDAISFETGAAMMLQGMTVQYLLRRTYVVKRPRSSASPTAPWSRWSTTAWARTRSAPASTASRRSG